MIKLNPEPTFFLDVEITVPGQDKPGTIPLTFKYRTREEYTAWIQTLSPKMSEDGKKVLKKGKTTVEAFPEFVESWGLSEEFNKKNIEIFLNNYSAAYSEIFQKYSEMLLVSRIKN